MEVPYKYPIIMVFETDTYKGNPIICLRENDTDSRRFQFGVKKAKLILQHVKDIEKFVKEGEKMVEMSKSWDNFKE